MKTAEKILWVVALIGCVIGLIGIFNRISGGHLVAAYNTYVPWGLWIAVYVTMIGISVGAFLIASLGYGFSVKSVQGVGQLSLLVALAALIGGLVAVWVDLGHPSRFLSLFYSTSPTSVMGWMAWFYFLYGLILIGMLYLSSRMPNSPLLRWLGWFGLPFLILFGGAEGSLFGVVSARSLWESGLTPILFLAEGVFSGVAMLLFLSVLFDAKDALPFLRRLTVSFLFVGIVLELSEYLTILYANIPAKLTSLQLVLFGPFWWVFWILHIGLGVLLPLIFLGFFKENPVALALGGSFAAFMSLTTKLNLVIPALVVPEFEGLLNAYVGPGLDLNYFPTPTEWLVSVFVVSLAAVIFLAGKRILGMKAT